MPANGRSKGVERLIAELGRASSALYAAHLTTTDSGELHAAHELLTDARQWAARVAREPDETDLGVVAAAWEAIAVAQDMVAHARRTAQAAREQRRFANALREEARMQAKRARARAERLRRWHARHPPAHRRSG
jgi:hypothetical protein